MNRTVLTSFTIFCLLSTVFLIGLVFNVEPVKADPKTIYVDDNNTAGPWDGTQEHPYQNITSGLGHASAGDIIYVYNGTYYENVVVTKSVSLIGENRSTTIIDGKGTGSPIYITANSVTISGFKIRNSRFEYLYAGIRVNGGNYNNITGNSLVDNLDGIFLTYSANNTICNNVLINNDWNSIHLKYNSNYNKIGGNVILNGRKGIHMEVDSDYNEISKNELTNLEWVSIDLVDSSRNIIRENNIWDSFTGIYLNTDNPTYNVIYHNNFIHNVYQVTCYALNNTWDNGYPAGGNFWSDYTGNDIYNGMYQNETGSDGIGDTPYIINGTNQDNYPLMHLYGSIRNLDTNLTYLTIQSAINAPETLNGHTIFVRSGVYYEHVIVNKTVSIIGENRDTTIIDGNGIGTVVDVLCQNDVNIEEFSVRDGYVGVGVTNSTSIVAEGLELSNTHWGVIFTYTNDSVIEDVTLLKSGIQLQHSSRNIMRHCRVKGYLPTPISSPGIYLWYESENNTLKENTLVNIDNYALILEHSDGNNVFSNLIMNNSYGLEIYYSRKNVVRNNTIVNSRYKGIYAYESVFHNKICDNMFVNNNIGISLCHHVSHNMIYHNNFLNNTEQVHLSESFNNTWDDGYPSGGNYWSDYNGTDFYHGSYQNETGSDGIGDTPYFIDEYNQDNYPLMQPYPSLVSEIVLSDKEIILNSEHTNSIAFTAMVASPTITNIWFQIKASFNETGLRFSQCIENVEIVDSRRLTITFVDPYDPRFERLPSLEGDTIYMVDPYWFYNWPSNWVYGIIPVYNETVWENALTGYMVELKPAFIGPAIRILSPESIEYTTTSIPLIFTVDEPTSWIGFSLDGQANVTISGNTTLTELSSGVHSIIVYANDTEGNMDSSDTVHFVIKTLLGTGWGWMRIEANESVCGRARLYKIGDEQIELTISCEGETYSRTWNITIHREYKYGERYQCYSDEWGLLIVGLHKHRRWQFWYAVGKGVVAFGFPRYGRLRRMRI